MKEYALPLNIWEKGIYVDEQNATELGVDGWRGGLDTPFLLLVSFTFP